MEKKTADFKAEVRELLGLVVHSLYSKKEIFLRELISNASDAIDRARFEGLTDKSLVADSPAWAIDIIADKQARTLTVEDNGIGMSAEEIETHLGTIAYSGTRSLLAALKERAAAANAPEMIGQFGVGFYSAFMVAERVTVDSLRRGPGQEAVRWSSDGEGGFTIEPSERKTPGTAVTLHLRKGEERWLEEAEVRALVKRFSDFIAYPIRFAADGRAPDAHAAPLNTMRALWRRSRGEVKEEEYAEFYRHLTRDFNPPLRTIHIAAEGQLEFRALLFIPSRPSFDLFLPGRRHGLHLYVRNVFVGTDFEELLPEHLRFVRGVVDSSDLPLNVSREMLQDDAVIRKIRNNLVGRIVAELETLKREQPAAYADFFRGFGRLLKEGLHLDREHAAKIEELLLFPSDRAPDGGLISLRQYREAMPSSQREIYYLLAGDLETARQSPLLEAFRRRGIDVLFLVDPVDEWIVEDIDTYEGCKLRAIDRGEIELGSESERTAERQRRAGEEQRLRPLLDFVRARLSHEIGEVRTSSRLTDPTDAVCCLVADEQAVGPGMAQAMKLMGRDVPPQRRALEINASHPLTARLAEAVARDRDDPRLAEAVDLLLDLALVSEGAPPRDARRFTAAFSRLLAAAPPAGEGGQATTS
jgi:molecular chaperone HtpG